MKFDFTVTFSIILALVSILANIINTLINNTYQKNLKKLEMYELQKREVLQNFINDSVECIKNENSWRQNKEFVKSLYTLPLYFKCADIDMINKINKAIDNSNNDDAIKVTFTTIIQDLSEEIEKH